MASPYRIKLVYIAGKAIAGMPEYRCPMALFSLRNYLMQHYGAGGAVSVDIIAFRSNEGMSRMLDRIRPEDADMVGLSCYVWNIANTRSLASEIKKRNPKITIVAGGPEIEESAEIMTANPAIDICVRGDAETLFDQIARALSSGENPPELNGLTIRRGAEVVDFGGRGVLTDFDSLPRIVTDDLLEYFTPRHMFSYHTARGCFCRCKYCAIRSPLSAESLDRVDSEIHTLLNSDNIAMLHIADSDLSFDLDRGKQILRIIGRHNETLRKPVHIYFSFINSDDEMLELIKSTGVRIYSGIQSINPEAVRQSGRAGTYDMHKIKSFIEHAVSIIDPLWVHIAFILGLPGDNLETFGDSMKWCQKTGLVHILISRLLALPGTVFKARAHEYGITYKNEPYYTVWKTSTFTAREIGLAKSAIVWYIPLLRLFDIDTMRDMASGGLYIWDIVRKFPVLGAADAAKYLVGADYGELSIRSDKFDFLQDTAKEHLRELARTDPQAREALSLSRDSDVIKMHGNK